MGKINILDHTGHVEIKWDDHSIDVDLNPEEGKANKRERNQIKKMIDNALRQGFVVKVDGEQVDSSPRQLGNSVRLELPTQDIVKNVISDIVKSQDLSHHLLFKVGLMGRGELVQKSEFEVDDAEYQAQPILAGG